MSNLRRILALATLLLASSAPSLAYPSLLVIPEGNPRLFSQATSQELREKPQALAFLHRLQNALRAQDKKQVATLIQYPLQALENGNPQMIQNQSQFLRDYDLIFTPAKIQAILQCKDSDVYYHADEGGYMIPYAVIWFDNVPLTSGPHARHAFALTTVNNDPPAARAPL
jgi:hypothetical protein